jgi:predicted PurR-regulated permease PerM
LTESVLRALLAAAAAVVIVAGLRAGATLLVPVAVAGMVAVTSYPLVAWLERHRVPNWAAVLLTLVGLVLTLMGPGAVVLSAATEFVAVAPAYAARLNAMSAEWLEWLHASGVDTSPLANVVNWAAMLNVVGALVANAAFVLSNALLVLFLVGFMLMETAGVPQGLSQLVGSDPPGAERMRRAAPRERCSGTCE